MTRNLLLLPLAATAVLGQNLTCTASAPAPPILRVEGISERIADVVLDCNSQLPAGTVADLSIFVGGTIVTNPLLVGNYTNALLLLDAPPTASQVLGQNVLQGGQQGSNSLKWRNLPVDGHRIFRLTNVRVSGALAGIGSSVQAFVSIAAPDAAQPLYTAPALTVATVDQGMQMTLSGVTAFSQCSADTRKVQARFTEQFASSFKSATQETGFYNASLGIPPATSGTRVELVLDTMARGTLTVTTSQTSASTGTIRAKYVGSGTVSDDGLTVQPEVIDGKAIAVWEVTASSPNVVEVLAFDVILVTTSDNTAASSPPVSQYCARGFFAPGTTSLPPRVHPAISRFADYTTALGTIGLDPSEVVAPFTSNILGFDTGIAVVGASEDKFANGANCSLAPYGSNSPGIYGAPQPYTESVGCVPTGANLKLLSTEATIYNLDPAAAPMWKAGFSAAFIGQDGVSLFTTLDASGASVYFRTDDLSYGATAVGDWLRAEIWTGTSPATMRYRVDPSNLRPGYYQRYITLRASGVGEVQTLPINIFVPDAIPSFERAGVTHAGSYRPGFVAPGQATVIFGKNFGAPGNDTHVYFDGVEVQQIYVYPGQVSVFAPFELTGKNSTEIEISYGVSRSTKVTVPVLQQNPSLLTARSDGAGPVAALNQDSTLNTAANGAPAGTIVTLFGTGAGQTSPASTNGQLGPANATFLEPMSVQIGGQDAQILYQGPAPTLTAGVFQLNVRIPAGVPSGPALVSITQGGQVSQLGNSVWVK